MGIFGSPKALKFAVTASAAGAILAAAPCRANIFYVEAQGGFSEFVTGAPFYGSTAPAASTSLSYGYNLSAFITFGDGKSPIDFQAGLQGRFSNGWYTTVPTAPDSTNTMNYSLITAFPVVRLQLSKVYLGVGATPLLWSHVGREPGLPFTAATGSIAALGELGLLWAVSPEFSLGANGALEYVSTGGTLSPAPIIDLMVSMRFYFGSAGGGGGGSVSSSGSNEYKGWRYPFGFPRD